MSNASPQPADGSDIAPSTYMARSLSTQKPRFQIFGVGGPQGSSYPTHDPFGWTGVSPVAPTPGHTLQYENARSRSSTEPMLSSTPSAQSDFSAYTDVWQVNNPDPALSAGHPGLAAEHTPTAPLKNLSLSQMQADQSRAQPSEDYSPSPAMYQPQQTTFPVRSGFPRSQSDLDRLAQAVTELRKPIKVTPETAGPLWRFNEGNFTEISPIEEPQTYRNFYFPNSAPSQQFPCPSCASTLCTCTNCPTTMQSMQGGAWSRACGRMGHLENPYVPNLRPTSSSSTSTHPSNAGFAMPQQMQVSAPQQSCCGNHVTAPSPVSAFSAQADMSHLPVLSEDWTMGSSAMMQQYPIAADENMFTLDPALLARHPSDIR